MRRKPMVWQMIQVAQLLGYSEVICESLKLFIKANNRSYHSHKHNQFYKTQKVFIRAIFIAVYVFKVLFGLKLFSNRVLSNKKKITIIFISINYSSTTLGNFSLARIFFCENNICNRLVKLMVHNDSEWINFSHFQLLLLQTSEKTLYFESYLYTFSHLCNHEFSSEFLLILENLKHSILTSDLYVNTVCARMGSQM